MNVLSNGLSFCPTNTVNPFKLKVDSFKFIRSLHLKHFFSLKPNANTVMRNSEPASIPREATPFKPKSNFIPHSNQNPSIVTYKNLIENDFSKICNKVQRKRGNLSTMETKCLNQLEKRDDIVIRPADKGGSVVILSKEQYNRGIMSQLNEKTHYTLLSKNPLEQYKQTIDQLVTTAHSRGWITERERDFLTVKHPICPVFYGLPKIHKGLDNPPLRPIVSSIGCLTEPLSQYLDFFLKKYMTELPSYLGDTTDILKILDSFKCEEDYMLVTCDVQSLYTCIPHTAGIEALTHYFNTRPPDVVPPNSFLLTLAEVILTKNYFQYAGAYYLQEQGVSMGSCFAPSYACLMMGFWEERFIFNPQSNVFLPSIPLWRRFVDDVVFFWTGSESQLSNFMEYINNTTPFLRFTSEHSTEKINFLDLTILKKSNGELETTIYRKPLSRNTLLRANSHHPKNLIKNIPIGQFLRLKRNCTNEADFENKAMEMAHRFRERGYAQTDISSAYQRARTTNRAHLLSKRKRSSAQRLCFSTEYSDIAGEIKNTVRKHWHILQSDPSLKDICAEPPIISFRRSRSLRSRLVQTTQTPPKQLTWLPSPPEGFYRCGRCTHCSNSSDTKYFSHPHTGKRLKINTFINCNTTHVVYILKCPCGLIYVGQTKRSLKLRIAEHKAAIRNKNMDYAIARHYIQANHGSCASLKFWGIDKITPPPRGGDLVKILLKREAYWIHTLNTVEPNGLNEELCLSCFL